MKVTGTMHYYLAILKNGKEVTIEARTDKSADNKAEKEAKKQNTKVVKVLWYTALNRPF